MYMPRVVRLIGLLVWSLIVSACGGGAGSRLDDVDGEGNGNSGGGGGGGGSANYLDCSALDPRKVYLLGTLSPHEAEATVIVNLDNPREFCAGLSGGEGSAITISNSGRVLFMAGSNDQSHLYEFVQDALTEIPALDGDVEWELPVNVRDNDVQVVQTYGGSGIFLRQDGSAANQAYFPRGGIYSDDSNSVPYFSNPNGLSLMGVMPDGSLLMYKDSTLYLVDTSFNELMLASPDSDVHSFENTSRVFTDPNTGNQSVWILLQDSEFNNDRRWKIDLVTKVVSDDGLFAAVPNYVDPSTPMSDGIPKKGRYKKLDGDGNLIQIAFYTSTPPGGSRDVTSNNYNSLVIKRPIASSQQASAILHSDAEYEGNFQWRQEEWPITHVFGSGVYGAAVFTGQ